MPEVMMFLFGLAFVVFILFVAPAMVLSQFLRRFRDEQRGRDIRHELQLRELRQIPDMRVVHVRTGRGDAGLIGMPTMQEESPTASTAQHGDGARGKLIQDELLSRRLRHSRDDSQGHVRSRAGVRAQAVQMPLPWVHL